MRSSVKCASSGYEARSPDGRLSTYFVLPSSPPGPDFELPPLSISFFDVPEPFRFRGRYCEKYGMEFLLAGPDGFRYKLLLTVRRKGAADYSWKVIRRGVTEEEKLEVAGCYRVHRDAVFVPWEVCCQPEAGLNWTFNGNPHYVLHLDIWVKRRRRSNLPATPEDESMVSGKVSSMDDPDYSALIRELRFLRDCIKRYREDFSLELERGRKEFEDVAYLRKLKEAKEAGGSRQAILGCSEENNRRPLDVVNKKVRFACQSQGNEGPRQVTFNKMPTMADERSATVGENETILKERDRWEKPEMRKVSKLDQSLVDKIRDVFGPSSSYGGHCKPRDYQNFLKPEATDVTVVPLSISLENLGQDVTAENIPQVLEVPSGRKEGAPHVSRPESGDCRGKHKVDEAISLLSVQQPWTARRNTNLCTMYVCRSKETTYSIQGRDGAVSKTSNCRESVNIYKPQPTRFAQDVASNDIGPSSSSPLPTIPSPPNLSKQVHSFALQPLEQKSEVHQIPAVRENILILGIEKAERRKTPALGIAKEQVSREKRFHLLRENLSAVDVALISHNSKKGGDYGPRNKQRISNGENLKSSANVHEIVSAFDGIKDGTGSSAGLKFPTDGKGNGGGREVSPYVKLKKEAKRANAIKSRAITKSSNEAEGRMSIKSKGEDGHSGPVLVNGSVEDVPVNRLLSVVDQNLSVTSAKYSHLHPPTWGSVVQQIKKAEFKPDKCKRLKIPSEKRPAQNQVPPLKKYPSGVTVTQSIASAVRKALPKQVRKEALPREVVEVLVEVQNEPNSENYNDFYVMRCIQ